ncbi:exported hypothetical protein [Verrucomicrobia bacterium]|nr:exported hypothetical protein [Verrucomicrobiota bacterium]
MTLLVPPGPGGSAAGSAGACAAVGNAHPSEKENEKENATRAILARAFSRAQAWPLALSHRTMTTAQSTRAWIRMISC